MSARRLRKPGRCERTSARPPTVTDPAPPSHQLATITIKIPEAKRSPALRILPRRRPGAPPVRPHQCIRPRPAGAALTEHRVEGLALVVPGGDGTWGGRCGDRMGRADVRS